MSGREADVPVFLAVTEGENVLTKQVYPVHAVFPPNVDRLTMSSPEIDIDFPVSKSKTGGRLLGDRRLPAYAGRTGGESPCFRQLISTSSEPRGIAARTERTDIIRS